MGIRAGRYQGFQELRACFCCSINHRFLGAFWGWTWTFGLHQAAVYLCSFSSTSTLSASLSSSQGVRDSLVCLGCGETPQRPQTAPEGRVNDSGTVEVTSSPGPTERSPRVNELWATTCQIKSSSPEISYLLLGCERLQVNQAPYSITHGVC